MKCWLDWMRVAIWLVLLLSGAQADSARREGPSSLPANLYVNEDLRPLLEKMWARSPTFRRQCARITEIPELVVSLRVAVRQPSTQRYRALTRVGKATDGATIVTVRIFNPNELVELIGHEFEHILEHLDGLDLRSEAVRKQLAARQTADGFFETPRAIRAGRQVDREFREAKSRAARRGTLLATF
jgi:hypothetical protein